MMSFIEVRKFKRINILKASPKIPDQNPKIKYKIPMSLWLEEKSHF